MSQKKGDNMILLGVDQSLSGTGCCIYSDPPRFSIFATSKDPDEERSIDYTFRLMEIRDEIRDLCKTSGVNWAAMEGISFGSHGRIAELGALAYMIREMFIKEAINFMVVPPTVVKQYWTGKGNAGKDMMIARAVQMNLDIPSKKYKGGVILPDDNCVDAYALTCFLRDYVQKINGIDKFRNKIEVYEP
jgi:Holliday junction resolvasome RuvABC endonuclease subunit